MAPNSEHPKCHSGNYNYPKSEDSPFIQTKEPSSVTKNASLVNTKRVTKPLLSTLDIIISIALVSPCVIGFWRGVWEYMDIYQKYFPNFSSFLIGSLFHIILILIGDLPTRMFIKKKTIWTKIYNLVVTKIYIYIFAIICIVQWRGSWRMLDEYTGAQITPTDFVKVEGSGALFVVFAASFLVTVLLKSVCNCNGPPFIICVDRIEETFLTPTRFKTVS